MRDFNSIFQYSFTVRQFNNNNNNNNNIIIMIIIITIRIMTIIFKIIITIMIKCIDKPTTFTTINTELFLTLYNGQKPLTTSSEMF